MSNTPPDAYEAKIFSRLAPTDGSDDCLASQLHELRSLMLQEYEQNQDLYDEHDFERFMNEKDDWHARRWLIYQREVQTAFEMAREALRWRKEIGLNDLNYEDFPREFFECACTFNYGHDRKNRAVIYVRCRLFRPLPEISHLYDKYFAFLLDQCDKKAGSRGFSMVYDVTDAGLSNVEMSTIRFMLSLRDKIPLSSRQILIVGLPWVLKPVFKIVLSIIPASHAAVLKTLTLEELTDYIDVDQLPASMGGSCKTKFQIVPAKSKYLADMDGYSESAASKLRKHVDSKIDLNDVEIATSLPVIR